MTATSADAAALERVLLRLVGTDEASLEAVLDKLLPLVIAKLDTPDPAVREAALRILAHTNARVNARAPRRDLGLPVLALARLASSATNPLVSNTALVYSDMAVRLARPDPPARAAAVAWLASGAARRVPAQRDTSLRLAVGGLEGWKAPREGRGVAGVAAAAPAADAPPPPPGGPPAAFLADPADRAALLEFATHAMLFRPPTMALVAQEPDQATAAPALPSINTPLGAALAAAAAAAGTAPPTELRPPPGLSLAQAHRVMGGAGCAPPSAASLAALKAGLLEWASAPPTAPGSLAAAVGGDPAAAADARRACLLWALIASADASAGGGGSGLQARAEDILRRRSAPTPSTAVAAGGAGDPLEDEALACAVLDLVVGHLDARGGEAVDAQARRSPPSPALAARALSLLCRSRVAAASPACFPSATAAIEAAVFSPGAPTAVVQAGAEFCVWVLRHASAEALASVAPAILDRLLGLLEGGGGGGSGGPGPSAPPQPPPPLPAPDAAPPAGPAPMAVDAPHLTTSPAAVALAWQALGALARRAPGALRARPELAGRLFSLLSAQPDGVRAAAQEAISCAASAYTGVSGPAADELCSLLTDAVAAPAEAVRLCAAVWAGRLFPRSHVPSRWVCVLAAGDARLTVREAGEAGLAVAGGGGGSEAGELTAAGRKRKADGGEDDDEDMGEAAHPPPPTLPSVSDLVAHARARVPGLARPPPSAAAVAAGGGELPLPAPAAAALLKFCRACRTGGGAADAPPPPEWLDLIDWALASSDAPGPLRRDALDALLEECGAGHAPLIGARYAPRAGGFLRPSLAHNDPGARGAAAKLLGVVARSLAGPAERGALAASLLEVASPPAGGAPARHEARDGAVAALGCVLAAGADGAGSAVAALTALASPGSQHAAAAAAALGHAGLAGPLPGSSAALEALAALLAASASKDAGAASAAAVALGRVAGGDPTNGPLVSASVDALLHLGQVKAPPPPEPVLLAAGEGLAWALGGHGVPADAVLTAPFTSLAARSVLVAAGGGAGGAEGGGEPSPVPAEATPPPPPVAAARARALDALIDSLAVSPAGPARAAGAAWLVSLLTCCPGAAEVRAAAGRAQAVLLALLSDPNELIQEAAPRGLCACYALAGAGAGREALLGGLADALAGGGAARARAAIKKDESSTVDGLMVRPAAAGGDGGGGGAPPGAAPPPSSASAPALATLRELASLATDMGQPDLVYRFAQLTAQAAALRSTRGAALGMASLAALPGGAAALAPLVRRLTPRLFRGLHDPHPAVRDAMATIWAALVPDPVAAVDAARPAIAAGLVADAGGRAAREREAALAGLADLVSRPSAPAPGGAAGDDAGGWSGLGPSAAGPALAAALKCADDVKPSVRAAAVGLARALRGAALRACEAAAAGRSAAAAAAAADALATVLPSLTEALSSPAVEVRGLALDGLAALAAGAPPAVLAPLLPDMLPPILDSLSGAEAGGGLLNYVDAHLAAAGDAGGRTAIEEARVAASRSGRAQAVLDAAVAAVAGCPTCGDGDDADAGGAAASPAAPIIPPLVAALKRGVGASTRAGAARFVTALASRAPAALAPFTAKLLAALLAGARADAPGGAVRRAYASAAGTLLKVASPKGAGKFVDSLAAAASTAAGGDAADRELAGAFALSAARGAPDAWSAAGGPAGLLPLAAVWRHDPDAAAGADWASFWDETAPGGGSAVRLYGAEMCAAALGALRASSWGAKAAGAAAIEAAATAGGPLIAPHAAALAEALRAELGGGRFWEGKGGLAKALGALAAAAPAEAGAAACAESLAAICARPASRPELKTACLAALAAAAPALPPAVVASVAAPALAAGLRAYADRRAAEAAGGPPAAPLAAASEPAGPGDPAPVRPAPVSALLAALPPVWKRAAEEGGGGGGAAALAALAPDAAAGVGAALAAGTAWDTRVAAAAAASSLAAAVPAGGGAAALEAWAAGLGAALAAAAGEPKQQAVRASVADALGSLGGAGLAPPGSPAATALDRLANSDASDTVKARAAAARARALVGNGGGS